MNIGESEMVGKKILSGWLSSKVDPNIIADQLKTPIPMSKFSLQARCQYGSEATQNCSISSMSTTLTTGEYTKNDYS